MAIQTGLATFVIQDAKGAKGKLQFHVTYDQALPDSIEQPEDFLGFAATVIDSYIDGAIVGISFSQRVPLPVGIKTVAVANSDVEQTALFMFRTVGGWFVKISLPTMNDNKFIVGTDLIDDQEFVLNFPEVITNPSTMTTEFPISVSDMRGDDINLLVSGRKVFKPR